MALEQTPEIRLNRIAAGMAAGALASIPMAVLLCAAMTWLGKPLELPIRLIAVTVLGDDALLPSARDLSLIAGAILHIATGALLGGVFGALTSTRNPAKCLTQALVFALGVWASMQFLILPANINIPLARRLEPGIYALSHLAYALGLLAILPFDRRLNAKHAATEAAPEETPRIAA